MRTVIILRRVTDRTSYISSRTAAALLTELAFLEAGDEPQESGDTYHRVDDPAETGHLAEKRCYEVELENPDEPPVDRPDKDEKTADLTDDAFLSILHISPFWLP